MTVGCDDACWLSVLGGAKCAVAVALVHNHVSTHVNLPLSCLNNWRLPENTSHTSSFYPAILLEIWISSVLFLEYLVERFGLVQMIVSLLCEGEGGVVAASLEAGPPLAASQLLGAGRGSQGEGGRRKVGKLQIWAGASNCLRNHGPRTTSML